ncbi:MAG: hypothetical protein GOU98_04305 [Candidatus Altiarchaeota archaeon]|nr:hypothetical protein [Candidatus Altiarchaeota archaeon]
MKFGIILKGPADKLTERAKKLNPATPIVIVDESTFNDPQLFAVFVFKKYRSIADKYNEKREKQNLKPFAIVDIPLGTKPTVSINSVRGRIAEILKDGPAYGYEIFKKYKLKYGNVSMRLIYYHINRGEKDHLFEIDKLEESDGNFSWGAKTVRKYYRLKSFVNDK